MHITTHCPYQVPLSLSGSISQSPIKRSDILRYVKLLLCVTGEHSQLYSSTAFFNRNISSASIHYCVELERDRVYCRRYLDPPGSLSSSSRAHPFPGSRHRVSALVAALLLTGAGGFHGAAAQLVAATFADGGVFHHANASPSGGKRKCTMQVEKRFISFSEAQKGDRNTNKNGWIIIK